MRQFRGIETLRELARAIDVAAMPALDVHRVSEKVPLLRIAAAVRENQVVPKIGRIARPRYEMIDAAARRHAARAIETASALMRAQHASEAFETAALCPE